MENAPQGTATAWRAIGRSVRGASHVRSALPNQDAIAWFPESGEGPPLIVSVSDGHGSPRNFRSDVGSRLAVEETTKLVKALLLEGQPDPGKLSAIKRTAAEQLPGELTRRWREAVARHLDKKPISQEELDLLEERRDARARRAVENDPHLAYGATLLSVLVTDSFIVYLQLGDGDILVVSEEGMVTRPIPRDPRLIANETTSLCMPESWREVRVSFQTLYGPRPALIMLSSDGYANSFVNNAAFLKVGSDILEILRTDGAEVVEENLSDWLADASEAGSGDDITMGILFPENILPVPKPEKPVEAIAESVAAEETETGPTADTTVSEATTQVSEEAPSDTDRAEVMLPEEPSEDTSPFPAGRKPRIELIKNENGPREPSKKLPNIFYDEL